MPEPSSHEQDDAGVDHIGIITAALVARFGDEARHVAQGQHAAAPPESRATWAEIVDRLGG